MHTTVSVVKTVLVISKDKPQAPLLSASLKLEDFTQLNFFA